MQKISSCLNKSRCVWLTQLKLELRLFNDTNGLSQKLGIKADFYRLAFVLDDDFHFGVARP